VYDGIVSRQSRLGTQNFKIDGMNEGMAMVLKQSPRQDFKKIDASSSFQRTSIIDTPDLSRLLMRWSVVDE
jgi:hypothetical protein